MSPSSENLKQVMAPKAIRPGMAELGTAWKEVDREQPLLKLLVPILILAWLLERFLVPFSNWVPLVAAVWLTLQFSKVRTRAAIDRLNQKWERFHLSNAVRDAQILLLSRYGCEYARFI